MVVNFITLFAYYGKLYFITLFETSPYDNETV